MSESAFDPETWQPVRLPTTSATRSADLPALDTFVSRELDDMRQWCRKHCRARWFPVDGNPVVFWFEQPGDAMAFAMEWFPYRCL